MINNFYQKDKSQDSINSKEKSKEKNNSKSAGNENSQQSGDQSKSSLVETEEELHNQKVSKIIVAKLKDNEQWRSHITNFIEPLLELEKGKLCKEEEKLNDSDNNIFDDDFMRSDFAVHDSTTGQNEEDEQKKEELDHKKFVKTFQKCFNSKFNDLGLRDMDNENFIEDQERDLKTQQYSQMTDKENEDIRNSLGALSGDDDQGFFQKRRDRSASNENYDLPPLPELEDNKDLYQNDDDNYMNYKSNENVSKNSLFSNLAANDEAEEPEEPISSVQKVEEVVLDLDLDFPETENEESVGQNEDKVEEEKVDEEKVEDAKEDSQDMKEKTQHKEPAHFMFEVHENDDFEREIAIAQEDEKLDEKFEMELFRNFNEQEQEILQEMKKAVNDETASAPA